MFALTQTLISRLPVIPRLFGPLTADGGLPVQVYSRCGTRCLTVTLEIVRLRNSSYCDTQAQKIRRSFSLITPLGMS